MNYQTAEYKKLRLNLILSADSIQNIGLMHGKIGIAIQFYHLSKVEKNTVFESIANELLDEIIPQMTSNLSFDFENGLSGIGWAFEYMVQNHFIEANTNEVLEEFDRHILQKVLETKPANISLLKGLLGPAIYFLNRVKSTQQRKERIIIETNRSALQHICNQLFSLVLHNDTLLTEPKYVNGLCRISIDDQKSHPIFDSTWNLPILIVFISKIIEYNTFSFDEFLQNLLLDKNSFIKVPYLQCNKLLLLLSLTKLRNIIQRSLLSNMMQILPSINEKIKEIENDLDYEMYIKEIDNLNITLLNGIAGVILVLIMLYEQTNNLKYKNECMHLMYNQLPNKLANYFKLDFCDFEMMNEKKIGFLQGISGIIHAYHRFGTNI